MRDNSDLSSGKVAKFANFPTILRNLRKSRKWKQAKLGAKLGVTKDTVSRWELGKTHPKPEQLERLAQIFNVTIDHLMGRERLGPSAQIAVDMDIPEARDLLEAAEDESEQGRLKIKSAFQSVRKVLDALDGEEGRSDGKPVE